MSEQRKIEIILPGNICQEILFFHEYGETKLFFRHNYLEEDFNKFRKFTYVNN